jgi:hypothetical protein
VTLGVRAGVSPGADRPALEATGLTREAVKESIQNNKFKIPNGRQISCAKYLEFLNLE